MSKHKKGNLELVEAGKPSYKVTPVLNVEGQTHILEGKTIPEFKAVSLIKIEGTTNFAPVLLTIRDGQVTEMLAGEPNMWQVAVDLAKIDFVNAFIRPEMS